MAEECVSVPDCEAQCKLFKEFMKRPLIRGEDRYLIDNRWLKQWQQYVGYVSWNAAAVGEQSNHPGPVDNSSLFKDVDTSEIKEHLLEELDFILIPKEAWDALLSWYSLMINQSPIARKVVEVGLHLPILQVEIYPLEFQLCMHDDVDHFVTKKFSKGDTLGHIEDEMRRLFNIPDNKDIRIWSRYGACSLDLLTRMDHTVHDASLFNKQIILIEPKKDDGTWTLPTTPKNTNGSLGYGLSSTSVEGKQYEGSGNMMARRYNSTIEGNKHTFCSSYNGSGSGASGGSCSYRPGLCGLSNLGNTCFMNSALQCMSNTPPLTQYFINNVYWDELNTENPLGMKGEIAKAYADLVKEMWSGKHECTAPRTFKMQVGRFAPQFSGYQQQDSQELMAFLLDGLHEDLNKIKKKPYVELRDADGRLDEVVAKEAWDNYRKRNNSIIVDIFHGLLKSTLVCPECSKISVTFDPFCYLTLPLPIKKERQIDICFVPHDSAQTPVRYKLTLPNSGFVSDLCDALHKLTDVPVNLMVVTSVYGHKFDKIFEAEDGLTNIMDRDYIYVYEVPLASLNNSEMIMLPVYMRQKRYWTSCTNEGRGSYLFGLPLLVAVSRNQCKFEDLYNAILKRMHRYVQVPPSDRHWWIKQDDNILNGGEVEMVNGDDDSPTADDSKDEDEGIDSQEEFEGSRTGEDGNRVHQLYSMHFVNSLGSSELEKIKDDGRQIRFSNRPYLAIDWHPLAKKEFYNDKLAEDVKQHNSMLNCRMMQKSNVIQLNECLELFTARERLSADDTWYCPSCKKHQQATKKFDLWSLPQVLVLCFKRFSYSRFLRDKIDTLVEFPPRCLNMGKYVINKNHGPATYDLISVCNHFGGMGGGHYTAFAKNKDDSKWYNFDDNSVSPVKEEAVVSKAAYVLFYIRRDVKVSTQTPVKLPPRDIPAAAGTPDNRDNGIGGSSSEEDSAIDRMETN